jgi:ABC-2 type transport system permease protein
VTAQHRELLARAIAALRRSALWWTVGIVALALVTVAFWPSLEGSEALTNLGDMNASLLEAFGAQNIATAVGYLDGQMYALMLPLLLSGLAIANSTGLTAGDEHAGRLELLPALPVSRHAIWLTRFAGTVTVQVVVAAVTAIVMVASLGPFSLDEVSVGRVISATAACALLALFHGAIGYLVSGFGAARGRAVGIAVLVLTAGYVVNFLFPLSDALSWARRASPWYWAIGDQPVSNGVDVVWLALLVLATAALVAIGTLAVERRDIRSA